MYADAPRRPAHALLTLLGAAWPLLAVGGLFVVGHLPRTAAPTETTPTDPRRDPEISLVPPSAFGDALHLPLAAFQYRRYQSALSALAHDPDAPQAAQWRCARDGSLYTYRVQRMELTAAATQAASLPDL